MEILLRYTSSEKFELLLAAAPLESFDVLLRWLDRQGIALVDSVPERAGLFCVAQKPSYCVYQSVWNAEDNMFNSYLIYSLQWLLFAPDKGREEAGAEDFPAAPVLVREATEAAPRLV
jgi:hypothetical protein